ncbi:MAG: hypothetical protein LBV73_03425 [Paraburkholderia sp.]|jgi:hypothetical protein|nr:hypothetical protein [Paraburkholderia sp.]
MEITRPVPNRAQATPRRHRAGTRAACATALGLGLGLGLATLAYWRADPVAQAREAYRVCAGDAASALHSPDALRREQALQALTDCAAQR